jgi:hypothetical protein
MSNWIGVRRVRFQEIDKRGNPVGEPTFGVIAADEYIGDYADLWQSLEDLNKAIEEAGGMLQLLEKDFGVDAEDPVFKDNYEGPKPSSKVDDEEPSP